MSVGNPAVNATAEEGKRLGEVAKTYKGPPKSVTDTLVILQPQKGVREATNGECASQIPTTVRKAEQNQRHDESGWEIPHEAGGWLSRPDGRM